MRQLFGFVPHAFQRTCLLHEKGNSMRAISIFSALFALLLCIALPASAAEQNKDFIFSGLKQYSISEQTISEFDKITIYKTKSESDEYDETDVEGSYVYTIYSLIEGEEPLSQLQILRNYENAVKSLNGDFLYKHDSGFHARFTKDGEEYYMIFEVYHGSGSYSIAIVKPQAMQDEITIVDSDAMLAALDKSGHIALYITFDTGKSTIKPESAPLIAEVVKAMQSKPGLNVTFEGHTDNVGGDAANQKLSEDRAQAVVEAVAKAGIDRARLASKGYGMHKPVAGNDTEEGRAKNRRVELVQR